MTWKLIKFQEKLDKKLTFFYRSFHVYNLTQVQISSITVLLYPQKTYFHRREHRCKGIPWKRGQVQRMARGPLGSSPLEKCHLPDRRGRKLGRWKVSSYLGWKKFTNQKIVLRLRNRHRRSEEDCISNLEYPPSFFPLIIPK